MNYYNDNDPKKTAWLRQLIKDGLIPAGDVDQRSIQEVHASDLIGYTQHHFFAGIGGWSFALQLAGYPSHEPVCSVSCPCQPFSQTGLGLGVADPRHLWPEFFRLTRAANFPVVFGEQVASPDGLAWLDGVSADMESSGYTFSAVDLCAAGVGAPHLRQRLFWVAYAPGQRRDRINPRLREETKRRLREADLLQTAGSCTDVSLADGMQFRRHQGTRQHGQEQSSRSRESESPEHSGTVWLADATCPRCERCFRTEPAIMPCAECEALRMGNANGAGPQGRQFHRNGEDEWTPWSSSVAILGTDGRARRIKPGILPLADGVPNRVALIGGAGDAIVPLLASEFIQACEEAHDLHSSNI